jgi:hypothetical protein
MSIVDYYWAASTRSVWAAWVWASGQGIVLGILEGISTIIFAMVIMLIFHRKRPSSRRRLLRAVGDIVGVILVLLGILLLVFFVQDAPNQVRIRDEKIAQLGGAPDTAIFIPNLSKTEKDKVLDALTNLSDFVNRDGRAACDSARRLQSVAMRDQSQAVLNAKMARGVFDDTRKIYSTILGPDNKGGILKSGDPMLVEIMMQAIQTKDRDTIVQFDGYTRTVSMLFDALLIVQTSQEQAKIIEPILVAADAPLNLWAQKTEDFCNLINKTNDRIAEMRSSLR